MFLLILVGLKTPSDHQAFSLISVPQITHGGYKVFSSILMCQKNSWWLPSVFVNFNASKNTWRLSSISSILVHRKTPFSCQVFLSIMVR